MEKGLIAKDVCVIMEKTKAIITANLDSFEEFEYYFSVIEIAEDSINKKPDVTIDCCKSLIEGVSKSVLIRLDNNYAENTKLVDKLSAIKLFNKAIKLIAKFDNSLIGKETDFLQKSKELVDTIINIRNDRGDISHGKFAPKPDEIISTSEFAVFVVNLTDSIVSFMLKTLFQIHVPKTSKLDYEGKEMQAYNNWLDENTDFPIKKAKYSQLLYENDYDEYESRYSDEFLKIDDIGVEENAIETEPETQEEPQKEKAETIEPKKEIEKLVSTFDEDSFWSDAVNEKAEVFAQAEDLKIGELKKIISNYLFSDKKPLRDEVSIAMNEKPLLKERAKIIDTLTEKIIALANDLKTSTEQV